MYDLCRNGHLYNTAQKSNEISSQNLNNGEVFGRMIMELQTSMSLING